MTRNIVGLIVITGLSVVPAMAPRAQQSNIDVQALVEELALEESPVAARELPFWRKPEKIYIVPPGYDDEERALQMQSAREAVGDVELVQISYPIADEVIADAEVLLARCTPRIIREAKNQSVWNPFIRQGHYLCG